MSIDDDNDPVLTTTEIASFLGVATRMVQNWIDEGEFGYRIPGSSHRRARRSEVLEFAKRHGITLPATADMELRSDA